MKWFGKSWGAPFCAPDNQAPQPQAPCAGCGKAFVAAESGVTVPFLGEPDDPTELAYHLACWSTLLGSGADKDGDA